MISQENRFQGHNSLKFLFSRGRTMRNEYFVIRYSPNPRQSMRLAIIVSKKVDKKAVIRNRIRRRLYELVRKNLLSPDLKLDLAIIVFSRELANMPHRQLEELCQPLFDRLSGKS